MNDFIKNILNDPKKRMIAIASVACAFILLIVIIYACFRSKGKKEVPVNNNITVNVNNNGNSNNNKSEESSSQKDVEVETVTLDTDDMFCNSFGVQIATIAIDAIVSAGIMIKTQSPAVKSFGEIFKADGQWLSFKPLLIGAGSFCVTEVVIHNLIFGSIGYFVDGGLGYFQTLKLSFVGRFLYNSVKKIIITIIALIVFIYLVNVLQAYELFSLGGKIDCLKKA